MVKGNPNPLPLNDNELNEMKNLRKEHEHLLDQLHPSTAKGAASYDTESDPSDEEEEDEAYQTKLKQTHKKKQRGGVSAEAYGQWN